MLTRLIATGLLAGVLSGACVSVLEHLTTVPLIAQAEQFESNGGSHAGHTDRADLEGIAPLVILAHDAKELGARDGNAPAPESTGGLKRAALTTLTTIGTATGFALMLLALMIGSEQSISARSGVAWGAAAFFATGLATSVGLPPELPGAAAADLVSRQVWWLGTAAATATGIWLMFRGKGAWPLIAGLALIAAPHLIGAPQADAFESKVPAELAGQFTAASLAVHAATWILAGALAGYFWNRLNSREALPNS